MSSARSWILLSVLLLLVGALLLGISLPASGFYETLFHPWDEEGEAIGALLAMPLILVVAVFLAWFCHHVGPLTLSKGELDHLLQQKHRGTLMHRSQRIRDKAARINRSAPHANRPAEAGLAPPFPPQEELDRLVQLKRRGAWAP